MLCSEPDITTNLDIAMENVTDMQVFKSHQKLYQPLAEFLKTKEKNRFRMLCTNNFSENILEMSVTPLPRILRRWLSLLLRPWNADETMYQKQL